MGSRSRARARAQASQPGGQRAAAPRQPEPTSLPQSAAASAEPAVAAGAQSPATVLGVAAIEFVEAAGVLLASILAGMATGNGRSYHLASGIAITLIGVGTAVALALVARGLRAGRRWTRTPALLTQLFTGIVGIYMTQGGRYEWGIPALVLAVAGIGLLMAPASVRLLTPGRARRPGQS